MPTMYLGLSYLSRVVVRLHDFPRSGLNPLLCPSVLCLSMVWSMLLGCQKQKQEPVPPSTVASADQQTFSAATPPSPRAPGASTNPPPSVVVPASADINVTLQQLSLELRRYVSRTRSVPKNFDEFVAKSGVQAPAAPAGKKYVIQEHAIVLVNR